MCKEKKSCPLSQHSSPNSSQKSQVGGSTVGWGLQARVQLVSWWVVRCVGERQEEQSEHRVGNWGGAGTAPPPPGLC